MNEEGLRKLGQQVAESNDSAQAGPRHSRAKPRRHRKLKWTLVALGLVVVLVVGAAAGYGWYLNHKIHRITVKDLAAAPAKGVDVGTQNILMVGSTSRCALKVQSTAYGLCSEGVTGVNSDVVMILHLDPTTHSVSILSIPRDLFVPNARAEGANKIDAALYEGPDQLIDAIQEDFGIPIQHYVELNFDTFMGVVNALGGIKMYFPEEVYDSYSGLDIQTTGCIALNGTQALQVVRARHLQYKGPGVTSTDPADWPQEAQSDIARIRRDHEFLRVLATSIQKRGLDNPITDQQILSSVVGQLEVDSGFSATDMLNLVLTFHSVNVNSAPQLTLPVAESNFGSYEYEGGDYGDVEFPAEPQDHEAIDQFLGLHAGDDTYSGGSLPSPATVTVSVMNGSGIYDQSTDTANSLQALGFHIGTIGDTTVVGQEAETVVYYAANNATSLAAAQEVANSMSGAVIMAYDPSEVSAGSTVTVVTGTDFSVNAPAPSSSTSGSGASTTTTTTSSSGSAAFAAPTPEVEALQPWDPRSCTASGGEGS
jgi:LCP family protein required for cell wall assembly